MLSCVCVCVCAVDFSEAVPLYCVPSFAGRLVRYTWKLSIGASRGLNADAKIIRIPFQVMTVPGEWLGGGVFWQGQSVVELRTTVLFVLLVWGGVVPCVWLRMALMCG